MRRSMLAVLAVLTLLLGTAAGPTHAEDDPTRGVVGRFLLTDMNGRTVTDEAYRGSFRLVVFGYTYCPDICPTVLGTLSVALDHLGAERSKVATLFISVDPDRDTPEHLKDYLSAFPGITGLTGTPEQVAAVARNFKIRYKKQPAEDGDPTAYSVDHSSTIFIMDRAGNFLARMPHASKPDRLAERVLSYLRPRAPE